MSSSDLVASLWLVRKQYKIQAELARWQQFREDDEWHVVGDEEEEEGQDGNGEAQLTARLQQHQVPLGVLQAVMEENGDELRRRMSGFDQSGELLAAAEEQQRVAEAHLKEQTLAWWTSRQPLGGDDVDDEAVLLRLLGDACTVEQALEGTAAAIDCVGRAALLGKDAAHTAVGGPGQSMTGSVDVTWPGLVVRQGPLLKICRRANKVFHFFLTRSGTFFYAERVKMSVTGWKLHRYVNRFTVEPMVESPRQPYAFVIKSQDKSFVVFARSLREKRDWCLALDVAAQLVARRRAAAAVDSTGRPSAVAPVWIPDKEAKECMICRTKFNMVNRKHHCRMCGRVLCKSCTPRKMLCLDYSTPQRVCVECARSNTSYYESAGDDEASGEEGEDEDEEDMAGVIAYWAAVRIQAAWRRYRERQRYFAMLRGMLRVQRWARAWLRARHLRLTIRCQAITRGFLTRRRLDEAARPDVDVLLRHLSQQLEQRHVSVEHRAAIFAAFADGEEAHGRAHKHLLAARRMLNGESPLKAEQKAGEFKRQRKALYKQLAEHVKQVDEDEFYGSGDVRVRGKKRKDQVVTKALSASTVGSMVRAASLLAELGVGVAR